MVVISEPTLHLVRDEILETCHLTSHLLPPTFLLLQIYPSFNSF
ncbi:rCG53244 [Rattus norvegicus]|uniref:RCG53244 n=1 Tax=Rattus norvegicus TaxID=10116 RepID=A6JMN7_RAT|nr:rCG53244 [Rattus norvegicus]